MKENNDNFPKYIEAILKGDNEATGFLFDMTYKKLFKFCFYLTGSKQLAEDICHDSYVKALNSLNTLKNHDAFLVWLKQIARNLFLDYKKSSKNSCPHFCIEDTHSLSELSIESNNEEIIEVSNILKKLSDDDRALLVLIEIMGFSYKETAQVLEIKEGTVKSRLFKIKLKLKELFENKKPLSLVSNM